MLDNRRMKAISSLLTHSKKADAAKAAGIGMRTLTKFLSEEEFVKEYSRQATLMIDDATRSAQASIGQALQTINDILADESISASVRLNASKYIVDAAIRLTEIYDNKARLEAVERILDSQGINDYSWGFAPDLETMKGK